MQLRGEALKSAYGLRITIRSYGHVMRTVAHIDPRGVRVYQFQTWVFRLQSSREFLPGLSVSPQFLIRPHLCSPRWEMRIRFGPVTNGLRNSPTGSKNSLQRGPCHQTSDRQYRSHAYRRARSAMSYIGLSLPNRILGSHWQIGKL